MTKALGQVDDFALDGAWWRSDGNERVEVTKPPDNPPASMGLDEGLRFLAKDVDPLLGRDAERTCYGTLHYKSTGALRLKLLGASDRVFDNDAGSYVVHGFDAKGEPCTVLDCFSGPSSFNMKRGFSIVEVVGNMLVRGAHITSLDELCFRRAELRITGLREFLTRELPTSAGGQGRGITGDEAVGDRVVRLPQGDVTFTVTQTRKPGEHKLLYERKARVRIELHHPEGYTHWHDRWTQPLVDLLRFATREAAAIESFVAVFRDAEGNDEDDEGWPTVLERRDVELIQPQSALLSDSPHHGYRRMLLSAGALGDDLDSVLSRWWTLGAKLGRVASLLFSVLQSRGYADAQLVTLSSVAEAYHRVLGGPPPLTDARHAALVQEMLAIPETDEERCVYRGALRFANGYPQRERIQRLISRAGGVVPEFERKGGRLANRIVDTRNDLVHLSSEGERPLQGSDLVEASALLVLALQANLLLDLGIETEHARALISESYGQQTTWQRLRRRGHAWPKGA